MLNMLPVVIIFLSFPYARSVERAKGFNALFSRPIKANVTCGSPAEQYFNTTEGYVAPRLRQLSLCDANNALYARPPQYMVDGDLWTSWQSRNNIDEAFITIDLNQAVYGKQFIFNFGYYRRPGQIAIFKSSDFGKTYHPWHYMVSQRQQCTGVFGIPDSNIFVLPDDQINRVLCQEYESYPFEYGEEIIIELNGNQRGDGSNTYESYELLRWMNTTNIHIRFSGLYRKFDYIDTRWHHYDVSEISLIARCDCGGHGDGITCPLNTNTGSRACTCFDNTCGDHCEKCCPAFNQYPWKRGSRSSWTWDNSTACEQCNCHSHSNVCVYNQIVANQRQSLDVNGKYSGGGVCQNCQHNTMGINCERCKPFFYRPLNGDPTSVNACPSCGCSEAGSQESNGIVRYLECISNTDMANLYPGMKVGECFCKVNVIGPKCDICKDEFFRLEVGNPLGCRPCACHLSGTVDRSNSCHRDFFGQCPCKANVKLRDCSRCKDGYYALRNGDPDGCKWCDCDVGASINAFICDRITGVCTCRAHISSRRCKIVEEGYYYPGLHYIQATRNLYSAAKSSLMTTLTIPHDSWYYILTGYTMSLTEAVKLSMDLKKSSVTLFPTNLPYAEPGFCTAVECYAVFSVNATTKLFYLNAGVYDVDISSSLSSDQFLIERVIAVPYEFIQASILFEKDRALFLQSCSVIENDMKVGSVDEEICMAAVYSMTVKFEDGALPCKCNPVGSMSNICEKKGGKCPCKPGVGGQDCSYCLPGFHLFSRSGCLACDCNGPDKVCDPLTGACNCPPNTQGRSCSSCQCNDNSNECTRDGICINCQQNTMGDHCELCKPGFYGDAVLNQCLGCNCHLFGSYNSSCHITTGQCYCRPGVVGQTCAGCAEFHFGLSTSGCSSCNCNRYGSVDQQCDDKGQCPCFTESEGLKCSECKVSFYGLPAKACAACECNLLGTVASTECSNDAIGQCVCKSGVEGRSCDRCQKQHSGFGISGCKLCPLCTRKLQSYADSAVEDLEDLKVKLRLTRNLTDLQTELKETEDKKQQVELNAIYFENRLHQGQADYSQLHRDMLIPWNARLSNLVNEINMVNIKAVNMKQLALDGTAKMTLFYKAAEKSQQLSLESDVLASGTFSHLVSLNAHASDIVSEAYMYVQNAPTFNFDEFEERIDKDLHMSNDLLTNITNIGKDVAYHQTLTRVFFSTFDKSENYFENKQQQWAASIANFLQQTQNVYVKGREVERLMNQTKDLIEGQNVFISSTEAEHESIQQLLLQTEALYAASYSVYEENYKHTQTVSGGIEVLFMQYNPQNSIVRVNVLRGYHLVARDYPSMLSDPFFSLRISPSWWDQRTLESTPKLGTLDPTWDWPVDGTYTFFITSEHIKITKLIITVYDYDDDGNNDFMGEVVIDLASILPLITRSSTQNTYTLMPQGYMSRWLDTFSGAGENSLLDLQNMLNSQINAVATLLEEVTVIHGQANAKANELQSQAQLLTSTFNQAKQYASKAVSAVNTYNRIYELINSSLDAALAANASVQAITGLLNSISVSTFTLQTDAELLAAQQFFTEIRENNITRASLQISLRSETYGSSAVNQPPRSSILINGHEYHPGLNGHTLVLLNYENGKIEDIKTFRTDVDPNAGLEFQNYIDSIPNRKIVIIVKQGDSSFASFFQNQIMARLQQLGGQAPFFPGQRGTYLLLGYKRQSFEEITWTQQVMRSAGNGASSLNKIVLLQSTLNELIETANTTFHSALPQWDEINLLFLTLKTSVLRLQREASTSSIVQAALEAANIVISQAVLSSVQVLEETQALLDAVNKLSEKFEYLVSSSTNISNVIASGQAIVSRAESNLPTQESHLQQATNIKLSFRPINEALEQKQLKIEQKLQQLHQLSMQMPFTIEYSAGSQSTYYLSKYVGNVMDQQRFMSVWFDVKPHRLTGVVWYLLAAPDSLTGIGLYMNDGYLHVIFNLGRTNIVRKNPTKFQLNKWYSVHLFRVMKEVTLIVSDSFDSQSVVQGSSLYVDDKNYIQLDANSRWYLNGFPDNVMPDILAAYGEFAGVYDNFHIDDIRYNLWNSLTYTGTTLYANYRYRLPPTSDGLDVTFFGNGYIKHSMGTFNVDRQFSSVKLEFRTLHNDVVIFGVTSQSGSFVYGLYMIGGKLMFQFATSLGNDIAVLSTRNSYNNGEWFEVNVVRNGVNATLIIRPLNLDYNILAETKSDLIGIASIPTGVTIIFGMPSLESPVPPLVTGKFAGDMRNLRLSNTENEEMISRRWDSQYLIEQKGTSYYGMIDGKIVEGIRFYGYMSWLKSGSYAMLDTFKSSDVNSVYMSFKTSQLTGMILYKPATQSGNFFYMGLVAGNLAIVLTPISNTNTYIPYITSNLTLSNGQWHNMSLAYSTQGFQLQVDGKVLYMGWFNNLMFTKIGTGTMYVGGIPNGVQVNINLPTLYPLRIEVDNFLINRMEQNFFSFMSSGVSYAGIPPGANTPRPPPSCAASFPDLIFAPDPLQVRFGKVPWVGYQSYLGYQLSKEVLEKYFTSSFVITMSFRAMFGDGVIFYIANSESNPTQYVSLEIINGQLRYEFFNGKGKVSIDTGNSTIYSGEGKLYKVYLLRIYQFGAMLLPETMEYKNSRHDESATPMALTTPLYIGGIPNNVYAPHFVKRMYGFNGCLKEFEISSGFETYDIDFTEPNLGGTHTGTTSCYSNMEPGVFFNGNDSWVQYANDFSLTTSFNIELKFRTYQRSGLLFYIYSKQTPQGVGGEYGSYALLELQDGKIVFHYKASLLKPGQTFEWKDQQTSKSYYLCDQSWHTVRVTKSLRSITITVDELVVFGGGFVHESNTGDVNGHFYIGGVKDGISKPGSPVRHFNGCLKLGAINGNTGSMYRGQDGNNVVFGCPTF